MERKRKKKGENRGRPRKETRGRKRIHPLSIREIPLETVDAAIRLNGGFLSKAAQSIGISLQTIQLMVKKYSTLRDTLAEARYSIVDIAEDSLKQLVESHNVTATIFALKCLGKERGYVEQYRPGSSPDAPLFIKIMPIAGRGGNGNGKITKKSKLEEMEEELPALAPAKIVRRRRGERKAKDFIDAEFSDVEQIEQSIDVPDVAQSAN